MGKFHEKIEITRDKLLLKLIERWGYTEDGNPDVKNQLKIFSLLNELFKKE